MVVECPLFAHTGRLESTVKRTSPIATVDVAMGGERTSAPPLRRRNWGDKFNREIVMADIAGVRRPRRPLRDPALAPTRRTQRLLSRMKLSGVPSAD